MMFAEKTSQLSNIIIRIIIQVMRAFWRVRITALDDANGSANGLSASS